MKHTAKKATASTVLSKNLRSKATQILLYRTNFKFCTIIIEIMIMCKEVEASLKKKAYRYNVYISIVNRQGVGVLL
jgi:hypothetical protein